MGRTGERGGGGGGGMGMNGGGQTTTANKHIYISEGFPRTSKLARISMRFYIFELVSHYVDVCLSLIVHVLS